MLVLCGKNNLTELDCFAWVHERGKSKDLEVFLMVLGHLWESFVTIWSFEGVIA